MRTNSKWFNALLVALFSCGLYSSIALAQEDFAKGQATDKSDKSGTNPINYLQIILVM